MITIDGTKITAAQYKVAADKKVRTEHEEVQVLCWEIHIKMQQLEAIVDNSDEVNSFRIGDTQYDSEVSPNNSPWFAS